MRQFNLINTLLVAFAFLLSTSAFGQGAVTVTPTDAKTGASTMYKLEFNLPDSLPSDGALSVTFPEGFDLSKLKIAASSSIAGGLELLVKDQEVLVMRQGKGNTIAANQNVDVLFSFVINPDTVRNNIINLSILQNSKDQIEKMQSASYRSEPTTKSLTGTITLNKNI